MSTTTVTRWRRYGKDRLYVTAGDGMKIGWYDLLTDQPHPETAARGPELSDAVRSWQAAAAGGTDARR